MKVEGYVVRFCESPHCTHRNSEGCPNAEDTKYYIDPKNEGLIFVGAPLVVAHDPRHVVGRCTRSLRDAKGIVVECVLDDYYLLECLKRRFDDFVEKYNPEIATLANYCKKTLCSFSLSHNPTNNRVNHISLVDTPGRKGTVVEYKNCNEVILKRRLENEHISDIVASHSTAYVGQNGRRDYLLINDKFSYRAGDLCYINASKDLPRRPAIKMPKRTSSTMELFKEFIQFRDQLDSTNHQPPHKVSRYDDECEDERVAPNIPTQVNASVDHPATQTPPPVANPNENTAMSMILTELKLLRESMTQTQTPPPPQTASEVSAPIAVEAAIHRQPQGATVEAAAPRSDAACGAGGSVIIARPPEDLMNAFVRSITGAR